MKYIRIMRFDHWIKQFFIIPGYICAAFLTNKTFYAKSLADFLLGFLSTCIIASANYVINEYLDAGFDRYHPTKKYRSLVDGDASGKVICFLWIILSAVGFMLSVMVNRPFLVMAIWLWCMGIVYNVKPLRTKDIVLLDVLSESLNNAIRFLMGWFLVSATVLPPCSVILGYWMAGAFLMAIKRYAEYRMIDDPEVAGRYRKSFRHYSEKSLLISAFFYAMASIFFLGVFLIKYRIELIIFMPLLSGLFCYYLGLSFQEDSVVQKPEKLYHEKGLMLYCTMLVVSFVALMLIDIPALSIFTSNELIPLH